MDDGATLSGGGNLTVSAEATRTVTTTVQAGSSGGVAVSPAVAIAIVNNTTTARLGTGNVDVIGGDASITATHAGTVTTTGDATAAGNSVAVGATVAVNVATDTTTASTARGITANGAVNIASNSTINSDAETKASAKGNMSQSDGGMSTDDTTDHEVNGNSDTAGPTLPKAQTSTDQANSTSSSESGGTGSSGVGVAAAIGVNVETDTNTASVGSGVTIIAKGGAVGVVATNQANSTAKSTGTALDPNSKANIGAAVGLDVATVANQATIGSGAIVKGQGITVLAQLPAGQQNDYIVWGLAAAGGKDDVGVAGSIGINVLTLSSTASVGSGAALTSSGGITVDAANTLGLQNLAVSGGLGTKVGVGASVVVNVISNTTHAFIDSSASADAADAISVDANSTFAPLVVNIPFINYNPQITSVSIAGAVSSGNAAIGGSVVVDVLTMNTDAWIGSGAQINQNIATVAKAGQGVSVTATDNYNIVNAAGGLGAAGGTAGIGIGIVVDVITRDVEAHVDPSANIKAGQNVVVNASSSQTLLDIAASVGAAGTAGVAGSIAVLVITNPAGGGTKGFIDSNAVVHAGGNMTVDATDASNIQLYAGGLAFGGTAGVGVSATVLVKTTAVDAYIGQGANVQANGSAGLSVAASQPDTLTTVAVAGGGGGTAGVAGSASVNVVNETTDAYLDQSAVVTGSNASVAASNLTKIVGAAARWPSAAPPASARASMSRSSPRIPRPGWPHWPMSMSGTMC